MTAAPTTGTGSRRRSAFRQPTPPGTPGRPSRTTDPDHMDHARRLLHAPPTVPDGRSRWPGETSSPGGQRRGSRNQEGSMTTTAAEQGRGLAGSERRCCSGRPDMRKPPRWVALSRYFTGAPPGTRTPNPRIKSGLLGRSGLSDCTDSTRQRSGSTQYTGIWPVPVPNPFHGPVASTAGLITESHRAADCKSAG